MQADALTLQRARRGDTAAFEALVTPCEPMLWRLCWQMLGNREDARDALQEIMVKAWRALDRFDGKAAVSTWLYRIGVNHCTDLLRQRSLRRVESLDSLREDRGYDPPSPAEGPAEALEHKERNAAIRQAIGQLPPDQRTALVLFALEHRSYEEIAALTGAELGTVKSRIARAREKLAGMLREDGNNSSGGSSKKTKGGDA
ncbi:MAG: sigma-70 family RNA polymerase sigma factor [Clostridia bacterium]|nr:sigma-70 family RNA polymerase sigma factor [Clostridia bacterium]